MWPTKYEMTEILVKHLLGPGKKFDDLQDSWFTKHLIIALREGIWALLLLVKMVYNNLSAKTATGQILDDKGYEFGVDRKGAVKAIHTVTLHKSTEVAYDLPVPDGFLLSTTPVGNNPPIKFVVMEGQGLAIPKGQKSISHVFVECTEYGIVGNVSDYAINLVAQAGFDYVTDSTVYIAGAEKEPDELYRERILERKRKPARAGVPADWERWALEVSGVTAAKCYRCARGGGTADIIIWGENGEIPTPGLIEKCQAYFEEKYMPADLAGGGILVVAPEAVGINISISNAIIKKGYTKETVLPILKNAFTKYFNGKRNTDTVTVVDCIVCIRTAYDPVDTEKTPVIEDFILELPNQNISITSKQTPIIGSITIEEAANGRI